MVGLETITIHDDGLRPNGQLVERAMHGQNTGIKNVDTVNILRRHRCYCPGQRVALNSFAKLITLLDRQLLGIVELGIVVTFRQNDRSREHRSGQTTPARLIASGLNKTGKAMRGQMDVLHLFPQNIFITRWMPSLSTSISSLVL